MERDRTIECLIRYVDERSLGERAFRGCGTSCSLVRSSSSKLSPSDEMTLRTAAKILGRLGEETSKTAVLNALKSTS